MRTFKKHNIRKSLSRLGFVFSVLAASTQVWGEPVAIGSYSIQDATLSGYGGWAHTFNGTITMVRDFTNGVGGSPGVVANYTSGGGTLNDGVFGNSIFNTELFVSGIVDSVGIFPVITLKLAQPAVVNTIKLSGGELYNLFPGQITGATVEIDGQSVAVNTIPVGTVNFLGVAVDDLIDLTGTPLASLYTDTVVIRDITFGAISFNTFSISEISIDGDTTPPPTPIAIDVKPHNDQNRIWKTNAGYNIKVALLASPTFDPASVLETSMTFGYTGDEMSFVRCKGLEDVNKDGLNDLVCLFDSNLSNLQAGDTVAIFKGQIGLGPTAIHVIGIDHVDVKPARDNVELDDQNDF